jgi:glycosyltransferase involved in cell wall biosynthesis
VRLLFVTHYFHPEVGAAPTRILDLAKELFSYGHEAKVTFATQRDLPLLADAPSTKMLEYMAAARPVVAAASGATAEVVAEAEAGIVCPPEQPEALAEEIAGLTADAGRARTMGLNGRRYVETNFKPRVAVERIERAPHSMVDA